jgi:hypothetical protein
LKRFTESLMKGDFGCGRALASPTHSAPAFSDDWGLSDQAPS